MNRHTAITGLLMVVMSIVFCSVISKIQKEVQQNAVHHNPKDVLLLKTIPGIGDILSLSILYEIHDIKRFPKHQHYAS